jgi:hypothetical protein
VAPLSTKRDVQVQAEWDGRVTRPLKRGLRLALDPILRPYGKGRIRGDKVAADISLVG